MDHVIRMHRNFRILYNFKMDKYFTEITLQLVITHENCIAQFSKQCDFITNSFDVTILFVINWLHDKGNGTTLLIVCCIIV